MAVWLVKATLAIIILFSLRFISVKSL